MYYCCRMTFQQIWLNGVNRLPKGILLECWLSAVSGLRHLTMSVIGMLTVILLSKSLKLYMFSHYNCLHDCYWFWQCSCCWCLIKLFCAVTSEQNSSQHLFGACCRSKLNLPASIEAVCDLLEEVVKLRPSLVQVRLKSLYVKQSVRHTMCYASCKSCKNPSRHVQA